MCTEQINGELQNPPSNNEKSIMEKYYDKTVNRATKLFGVLVVVCIVGVVLFGITAWECCKIVEPAEQSTEQPTQPIVESTELPTAFRSGFGIFCIIVAIFMLIFIYMVFNVYKQTLQELSIIYDRIWAYDFLGDKIEKLNNDSTKDELYKKLVESALEDVRQLSEKN